MTDFPIGNIQTSDVSRVDVFSHYVNGALTTGTEKCEWIVPFNCQILSVICDSETAGVTGGTSDIIDVNKNGTTIFTTQSRRPTLLYLDTGQFTTGVLEIISLSVGDILSYDVDQICTTGSARFKIAILVAPR